MRGHSRKESDDRERVLTFEGGERILLLDRIGKKRNMRLERERERTAAAAAPQGFRASAGDTSISASVHAEMDVPVVECAFDLSLEIERFLLISHPFFFFSSFFLFFCLCSSTAHKDKVHPGYNIPQRHISMPRCLREEDSRGKTLES